MNILALLLIYTNATLLYFRPCLLLFKCYHIVLLVSTLTSLVHDYIKPPLRFKQKNVWRRPFTNLSIFPYYQLPLACLSEKLSCETQLIEAINDWALSINRKCQTDMLFLDFSKAFNNKVAHRKLLHKIDHYGIVAEPRGGYRGF